MRALISWSTAERTRIPQISHVTARLVREAFPLEDLGGHPLKGVAEAMPVFRVLGPMEVNEDEIGAVDVPFLVGRDEETRLLLRRWEQAKEGLGQVALVTWMLAEAERQPVLVAWEDLHWAAPDAAQAEACFQQALALARHQEAKSWELCAATSLARLR